MRLLAVGPELVLHQQRGGAQLDGLLSRQFPREGGIDAKRADPPAVGALRQAGDSRDLVVGGESRPPSRGSALISSSLAQPIDETAWSGVSVRRRSGRRSFEPVRPAHARVSSAQSVRLWRLATQVGSMWSFRDEGIRGTVGTHVRRLGPPSYWSWVRGHSFRSATGWRGREAIRT